MRRRRAYLFVSLLCIATVVWVAYPFRSGSLGSTPNPAVVSASPTKEFYEQLIHEAYAESLTKQQITAKLGSPGWKGKSPNGSDMAIWESTFGMPPLHDRRYRFHATFSAEGRINWSSVTATDDEGRFRQLKADSK